MIEAVEAESEEENLIDKVPDQIEEAITTEIDHNKEDQDSKEEKDERIEIRTNLENSRTESIETGTETNQNDNRRLKNNQNKSKKTNSKSKSNKKAVL